MKNKTIYTLLVATVFASVFLWQYTKTEKITSSTDPAVMPVKKILQTIQQEISYQQLSKTEKLEKVNETLEKLPPEYTKIKRQYQIAMSTLPTITFWGRVLDQYNQPVVGASIFYTGTSAYLAEGGGRGQVYTDELGYFEISTVGAELVLSGIGHPEIDGVYYVTPEGLERDAYFRSHSGTQGFDNWKKHTSKETAYIVHAWRLSKYEGAFNGNTGYLDSTGNVYTFRFSNKWNAIQRFEGVQPGQLRASCTRAPMTNNRDYGDWEVHITPVNGGIQETSDPYLNIAPESGYKPSLDIIMRKGSKNYAHKLRKSYYFTSNNGNEYGSLQIRFEPYAKAEDDLACIVRMKYKINPTGSRNLELKSSNTSQPQLPTTQKLVSKL